jgi:hypothetical protein
MRLQHSKSQLLESKNELKIDLQTGIASHFKDIMKLRKHDPPLIVVSEPTKKGSHHEYKVKGYDYKGEFEIWRRYNNFYLLRSVLFQRFMGLYVPPIPEKKKLV